MNLRSGLLCSLLVACAAAPAATPLAAQVTRSVWRADSAYSFTMNARPAYFRAWSLTGVGGANRMSAILQVEEVRPDTMWVSNFAVVFAGERGRVSFEISPTENMPAAPVRIMHTVRARPFTKMRGLGLDVPVRRRVRLSVDWSRPEDVLVAIDGAVKRVGALDLAADTLILGVSGGRLRVEELTLCGGGGDQPCAIPPLDRSAATELWQPREDTARPLDLAALAGLWQVPGQAIWVGIGRGGSAFQCRQAAPDRVYTTSGVLSAGGVLGWRMHWEDAQVTSDGTRLVLRGELSTVVLERARDPLSASCGGG
jgi:hypothetical protein